MNNVLNWTRYTRLAREAVAEGAVLLENGGALPIKGEVAVFGRMQLHYYKSGTGSGGMVNAPFVTNIIDGLKENGAKINEELLEIYKKWESENPLLKGEGWGAEPWSQPEMPLDEATVKAAAERSETALVIIARTAGEEQENKAEPGSYYLTEAEENMIAQVCKVFEKTAVILNTGNIIDMSFVKKYNPNAVMYVWQGGMCGGLGAADVLCGKSPSGKLPDTIPVSLDAVPSNNNFGDPMKAVYAEDIFVGYRYYETFAQDKVLYPFGYGLSYTTFYTDYTVDKYEGGFKVIARVRNRGGCAGREVIQIYVKAPSGKLGKASRVLCGFEKSSELGSGGNEMLIIDVPEYYYSSYDDSGVTGFAHAYVLEAGKYEVYAGSDVRSAKLCGEFTVEETRCVRRHTQALAPVESFERMTERDGKIVYEPVTTEKIPAEERRLKERPTEFAYTGDKGFKFTDIGDKCTMEEFTAQLTDSELCYIARGEGCGSPKVTPGTTSAFGGITPYLNEHYLIPIGCTSDGPSGMRFDCGTKAFSLPIGTLIASTFNRSLIKELFECTGKEVTYNKVDCLLGPGMNIHRHPLGGRNFEYFSEDPFLTGKMAAAELHGLRTSGVTGTIKHFCGNNQEVGRHTVDSVVSERAVREIYLKGFEMAVREGGATTVMTTYGRLNGAYTATKYDLCTTVLRNEWGFKGFVMTDWWPNLTIKDDGTGTGGWDKKLMAAAQNDIYMCVADAEHTEDTLEEGVKSGFINRAELARNAINVFDFLLTTHAYKRIAGEDAPVEIINRNFEEDTTAEDLRYFAIDENHTEVDVSWVDTSKGTSNTFVLDSIKTGLCDIVLTGSTASDNPLMQAAVTISCLSTPLYTFTFNGTGGKDKEFRGKYFIFSRYTTIKLFFAQSGIDLKSLKFEWKEE